MPLPSPVHLLKIFTPSTLSNAHHSGAIILGTNTHIEYLYLSSQFFEFPAKKCVFLYLMVIPQSHTSDQWHST